MVDPQKVLRTRFEFTAEGTPLVGWLYSPAPGHETLARAVLTGPLTSVKEQSTGNYAAALATRGIEAVAFDHRTFGESGGEPRQFENPFAKIADIQAAASALIARSSTTPPVLGVGICAGGGYMAGAVAESKLFSAFIAVAGYFSAAQPDLDSSTSVVRGRRAEEIWRATGVSETIPAVAADCGDVAMPLREAFEYYGTPRGAVTNYVNAFAVQSLAYTARFDSQEAALQIDVPTLIIHSERALAPPLARRFAQNLTVEHEEVWLNSKGQIDFYDDPTLITAACDAVITFLPRIAQSRSRSGAT